MKTDLEALLEFENLVNNLLQGKTLPSLDWFAYPVAFQSLGQKLDQLNRNIADYDLFAKEIALGHLAAVPPDRNNLIAGSIKEIHSQLSSLSWSLQQLIKGNMVSKIYYPGELFGYYNELVDKVSNPLNQFPTAMPEWGSQINSWRYHQILSAINQLRIMLIEVDEKGSLLFANPSARMIFPDLQQLPYDQPDLQDNTVLQYLCSFSNRAKPSAVGQLQNDEFPITHEIYDPANLMWLKITTDIIRLADGSIGFLHMIDDISEWKYREEKLRQSVDYDNLTSTYTREAGLVKLKEFIEHRYQRTNCVAFIDIDGLKFINDHYGHNEGDFTIKMVANVLLGSVRDTDWVVRYGGDEFLILFMNCSEEIAWKVIERMHQRLNSLNTGLNKPYLLSISTGLSAVTEDMIQVSDLIGVVDAAMYQDKIRRKRENQDTNFSRFAPLTSDEQGE